MNVQIFPFDLHGCDARDLFMKFVIGNKRFTNTIRDFSWSEAEAKITSPSRVQFKVFKRESDVDSYNYGRKYDEIEFVINYLNGELAAIIQQQKTKLAVKEYERREEERLRLETLAKIAEVYREMFGEEQHDA